MVKIQKRLGTKKHNYSYGAYNKHDKKEQWIRITEGCPCKDNGHEYSL